MFKKGAPQVQTNIPKHDKDGVSLVNPLFVAAYDKTPSPHGKQTSFLHLSAHKNKLGDNTFFLMAIYF